MSHNVDLTALTAEQLLKLQKDVEKHSITAKKELIAKTKEEVINHIKQKGLTVADLFDVASDQKKVAIKYRDPDNHEYVWSGRGKTPLWIRDILVSGKTLESLLVA